METVARFKPAQVKMAVICLSASVALGLVNAVAVMNQPGPHPSLFILVSAFAAIAFVIYKISQGRNWARIAFLVLTLVATLPFDAMLLAEFGQSFSLGVLNVVKRCLDLFAFYLLFTAPGKSWFKQATVPASFNQAL